MNVTQSLYLIAFIVFTSCGFDNPPLQDDNLVDDNTQPLFSNVDNRLVSHFQEFENEAADRGFDFDLNALGITGVIEQIPEDGVAGTCQYGLHIHHVTIDANFWNNASQNLREFVVFHELGHCVLNRDHEEGAFANGICISIMRSGLEDCRDAYNPNNRNYYLDELFSTIN